MKADTTKMINLNYQIIHKTLLTLAFIERNISSNKVTRTFEKV
jgi:hypothetical protein